MARRVKYSPEVRERAVPVFRECVHEHPSEWAAMKSIAVKIGCNPETLRGWVRSAKVDAGQRAGVSTAERERIKDFERENRELKRANDNLRKAAACFAQAEIDRNSSRYPVVT